MKDKIKYWMGSIAILGVLVGRILNRVLTNHFGDNASNLIVAVSVAIVLCVILLLITTAHYIEAIALLVMLIPLIISAIGLYLNNMDLVGLGILLVFIIYPILIKVIPKFKQDR